jgi:type IV pilus assembly protein PilF
MASVKKYILFIIGVSLLLSCSTTQTKKQKSAANKAELYYDYGTKQLVDKNYTKALINLKKALRLKPDDSRIHNNLGMTYFFKKENKKAIQHLKKSVELDPKNSDAQNNLASLYFYQKKYKKAYSIYLAILKNLEYNQQHRTYYNLALIDLKFNRNQKALEKLTQSIKEKSDYCAAHYQLGALTYKNNNLNESLKHFTNGTKGTCLKNPAPHIKKAQVLIDLNQDQKALFVLRNIIERFPNSRYAILAKRKLRALNINKFRKTYNAQKVNTPSSEKL